MNKTVFGAAVLALAATAGVASADMLSVNAYQMNVRVFNDFPDTNLTVNGVSQPVPATYPLAWGPLHINEQFAQGAAGNFANKHIGYFSSDGGATPATTNVGQNFTLSFDVLMTAGDPTTRKEAGIEIHQPRPILGYTDEGQVLIASDGEVAVFGATLPFTGFGSPTYTIGTTAHVQFNYFAPGTVDPTLGAYQLIFTDAVTGVHDSGYKIWGNAEPDGIVGMTDALVGLKLQNQRNPFIADSCDVVYSNVSIVPTPGAMTLLGLAGLAISRRRR
jgi:uncharacterized protein (TIGR03382 family)